MRDHAALCADPSRIQFLRASSAFVELQYKLESSYPLLKSLVPEPISGPTLLCTNCARQTALHWVSRCKQLAPTSCLNDSPRFELTQHFGT